MEKSLAFLEGFYAFHNDKGIDDNPYEFQCTEDNICWVSGFLKARDIYLKDIED